MSEFKKANKSGQRAHKERSQPLARRKLGFLEKKKDYKLRARDAEKKKNTLRLFKKKALNKNPDEFYFHMCNSKLDEDGVHREKDEAEAEEVSEEQVKLMQTQDFKYVSLKRNIEAKKIERLKSSLHLLDAEGKPKNKHTFFVETQAEMRNFDVATRLDTLPELVGRSYNRPRKDALAKMRLKVDAETAVALQASKARSYRELQQRLNRQQELDTISSKLEVKRHLANKNEGKPKRIRAGSKTSAPIYRWPMERKR